MKSKFIYICVLSMAFSLLLGCGNREERERSAEWILKLFSSGDSWERTYPDQVSMIVDSNERVLTYRNVSELHRIIREGFMSGNGPELQSCYGSYIRIGEIIVRFNGVDSRFSIYRYKNCDWLYRIELKSPTLNSILNFKSASEFNDFWHRLSKKEMSGNSDLDIK